MGKNGKSKKSNAGRSSVPVRKGRSKKKYVESSEADLSGDEEENDDYEDEEIIHQPAKKPKKSPKPSKKEKNSSKNDSKPTLSEEEKYMSSSESQMDDEDMDKDFRRGSDRSEFDSDEIYKGKTVWDSDDPDRPIRKRAPNGTRA